MTYEIYKYKCRGLYEQHKYLFLLMMTLKIDLQKGYVTFEEFQNFIKGNLGFQREFGSIYFYEIFPLLEELLNL